jgi:hypothetical protein
MARQYQPSGIKPAKALSLEVPPSPVAPGDEVIEREGGSK